MSWPRLAQPTLYIMLLAGVGHGCHPRSGAPERARQQLWERCQQGKCKEFFVCRYDRAEDGGLLDRCVPEPGRCRWNSDCLPMQRCVRLRPDAVGLCWDRPPS
ncbi:MAG TPA: hypothetical protein VFZ61_24950 [Polyangiales bacterium]